MEAVRESDIGVIIAASGGRTELLADRALPSIYAQMDVDPGRIRVVVVDDNEDVGEHVRLRSAIEGLRSRLSLHPSAFPTALLRNRRTRGHSGTGAWNTGFDHLSKASEPPMWVAVLDDDDEYLPAHLGACLRAAEPGVVGVFERLEWVRSSGVEQRPFEVAELTPAAFFVGNPGVQGSNLFLRLESVLEIGGFDEALPNTTDRDLMIRLLRHAAQKNASVRALSSVGVRYYDHAGPRVNTDLDRKRAGLNLFYTRHAGAFTREQVQASLHRARAFFGYEGVH